MAITDALAIVAAYENVKRPNLKLRQVIQKARNIIYIHANDYLEMQNQREAEDLEARMITAVREGRIRQ